MDTGTTEDGAARQGIQSVEIGVRVLLAMEQGAGPMTLTEIAQRSGIQPSKVHRYLVSLCRSGLASQSAGSGRYDFGPTMRRLGGEALRRTNEVSLAAERMPGLRDRTGHSVNLSVWGDDGPVVVRWDYGAFALPLVVRVGATLPLLESSAGQVFLSLLPPAMTERALATAARGRGTSADALRKIRAAVQRRGVAVTQDGVIPGIASISAGVATSGDALPMVLSVVLPVAELTDAERRRVTVELLATARAVAADLGVP